MNVDEFRRAGHEAIEQVAAYYEKLGKGSAQDGYQVAPAIKPGDIFNKIPSHPPEKGESFDVIQQDFENLILPGTCHWQHPSFFAYFPANSSFESIIADIYATATSTPGFNHSCNPVATEVEQAMTSWVGQMLGLDRSFSNNGVVQGTASESALVAAIAARERAIRIILSKENNRDTREEIFSRLVLYGSTQTHSLGAKAALLLGIPFKAIETTKEDSWSLRGPAVAKQIAEDEKKGLIPFMIIGTVGTTSSGAVDAVDEICAIAAENPQIWVHVDAAWAGVYLALPEYRKDLRMDDINRRYKLHGQEDTVGEVHSFCTNLHKSGLVALECSMLFVRNSKLLTDVMDVTPPFLRNHSTHAAQVTDYRNWGITLGRRFRSLKILFMLKSNGTSGFQAHLRRSIQLAETLEAEISRDDRFELVTPRSLALLVFRLTGSSAEERDEKKLDDLNRRLYANLHKNTAIQLTSTVIGGIFCIRFAIGGILTREEHVLDAWRIVQHAAAEELGLK